MGIKIVIPTYTNHEGLKVCLESIKKYTNPAIEVVVVANGAPKETKKLIKDYGYTLLWNDKAMGHTKATNQGIKYCLKECEVTILLNDDTVILGDDWVDILIESDADITAPFVSYCPHAKRNFAIFFCVAINNKVFKDIGLLDEIFSPGGGEDTDFCIRAENAGYKLVQVPNSNLVRKDNLMVGSFPIYHEGEATVKHLPDWTEIFNRNSLILQERYDPDSHLKKQDASVYAEIFGYNSYGVMASEVAGKKVIDVGSNRGFFSILCDRYKAKKIYAIEANPNIFPLLEQNTANIKNIKLIPLALWNTDDEEITISDDGGSSSVGQAGLPCKTITLKTLLKRYKITGKNLVLKMDIEGAEYEVLEGVDKATMNKFDTIYMEIHYEGKSKESLETLLSGFGFTKTNEMQMFGWEWEGSEKVNERELPVIVEKWQRS